MLPGTAPLCKGASPATSPSQSEGSGQIAGPVRAACPAPARALSPLLAPRRLMSAPQEQRTSTYMHIIGTYVKCPLLPLPWRERDSVAQQRRERGEYFHHADAAGAGLILNHQATGTVLETAARLPPLPTPAHAGATLSPSGRGKRRALDISSYDVHVCRCPPLLGRAREASWCGWRGQGSGLCGTRIPLTPGDLPGPLRLRGGRRGARSSAEGSRAGEHRKASPRENPRVC